MTVCYFGNYDPKYARNQILLKGLRQNGVKVLECQTRERGWRKFWSLWRQHWQIRNDYDVMVVGFSGFSVMRLAKLLSRKPIVFDAFVSLYLSDIDDRKLYQPNSRQAKKLARLDKTACQQADRVLLDTQAQIDYFVKQYQLPREKFVRLPVGSDDEILRPDVDSTGPTRQNNQAGRFIQHLLAGRTSQQEGAGFIIHWHGHILPFYSLETVAFAADLLRQHDIEFRLICPFNTAYLKFKELVDSLSLTNVKFHDRVPYDRLAGYINQADLCLGIFGNSLKAKLVIPNKIYEAAACGKLVVTACQDVIYEVFHEDVNIISVHPEDARDLADKILWLMDNPGLRASLARQALELFKEKLTPRVLGEQFTRLLDNLGSQPRSV